MSRLFSKLASFELGILDSNECIALTQDQRSQRGSSDNHLRSGSDNRENNCFPVFPCASYAHEVVAAILSAIFPADGKALSPKQCRSPKYLRNADSVAGHFARYRVKTILPKLLVANVVDVVAAAAAAIAQRVLLRPGRNLRIQSHAAARPLIGSDDGCSFDNDVFNPSTQKEDHNKLF